MEPVTGQLIIKQKRTKPLKNRHPWVFSGAVETTLGSPESGDFVDVVDGKGRFLGRGTYNPDSQICARILSWDANEAVDASFWERRIQRALDARTALALPNTNAMRLIFGEADNLPGLVVDRYDDYLVMQCLTSGIDRRKREIADILADILQPRGIVERSDVSVRNKEGLPQTKGMLLGDDPPDEVVVQENGLSFTVNLLKGHKTGLYLDQRDNRALFADPTLVAGKRVLNAFAYSGGFAVYAATGGAAEITNIDTSIPVLTMAERNLAPNELDRPQDEQLAGDVFEVLRYYRDSAETFDVIILDPPKFMQSQRDLKRASRGYKDLNWLALRLLKPGGVLATFSCSGLLSAELFQKIVFGAAVDAGRDVQIMQSLQQGADHPVLLTFPESAYLKGLLCRVW